VASILKTVSWSKAPENPNPTFVFLLPSLFGVTTHRTVSNPLSRLLPDYAAAKDYGRCLRKLVVPGNSIFVGQLDEAVNNACFAIDQSLTVKPASAEDQTREYLSLAKWQEQVQESG
jgi:hypothetical protein